MLDEFILRKYNEIDRMQVISNKLNERIMELNSLMSTAVDSLKHELNIFGLSSSKKSVDVCNIHQKDLVSFTMRINTNYSHPYNYHSDRFLPSHFLFPYPREDKEIVNSILKFNLDNQSRLFPPLIEPEDTIVKKGTVVKLKYPDTSITDVFFKFTTSHDTIPSFFSGEVVSLKFF